MISIVLVRSVLWDPLNQLIRVIALVPTIFHLALVVTIPQATLIVTIILPVARASAH